MAALVNPPAINWFRLRMSVNVIVSFPIIEVMQLIGE
jgi:hypothetical protein